MKQDPSFDRHSSGLEGFKMSPVRDLPPDCVPVKRWIAGCRCLVFFMLLSGATVTSVAYGLWRTIQEAQPASVNKRSSVSGVSSTPSEATAASPQVSMVNVMLDPSLKSIVREATRHAESFNEKWQECGLPVIPVALQRCVAIESSLTELEILTFQQQYGLSEEDVKVYDLRFSDASTRRVYVLPDGTVLMDESLVGMK